VRAPRHDRLLELDEVERRLGEWIFIGLAAVFLLGGHPFPAGTLAFGCFFIGALLHELRAYRLRFGSA
jgi:hypothetical protein